MPPSLPPPANWQDFERLCLTLWQEVWKDPGAQRNGRQGQAQHGVDLFGRVGGIEVGGVAAMWGGVQCRLRDELAGRKLSEEELRAAIAAALRFEPALGAFTVATTAPRDARIQGVARQLSQDHARNNLFAVQVFAWDDICEALWVRPHLIPTHFPEFYERRSAFHRASSDVLEGVITGPNVFLECDAFFEDPDVRAGIGEELRIELRNVVIELALNAFQHGRARRCGLEIHRTSLAFWDEGRGFDSLAHDGQRQRGSGLAYLAHFLEKHRADLRARYERGDDRNRLEFSFTEPLTSLKVTHTCTILLRAPYHYGPLLPSHVHIPDGCKEYRLDVPAGRFNPSSLSQLLRELLRVIGPECSVMLRVTEDLLRHLVLWQLATGDLDPTRLTVE